MALREFGMRFETFAASAFSRSQLASALPKDTGFEMSIRANGFANLARRRLRCLTPGLIP